MLKKYINKLKNPDKLYRGIPFWSWNDKLEEDELRWQVREQEKAGLGGYFMHARGGLNTPYLGRDWMNSIKTCIDEGNSLGMGSWLYDENGWPSGFAGGVIPSKGIEYQQKHLQFEVANCEDIKVSETTIGIYRTKGDFERIEQISSVKNEKLLHVYYKANPYYADLLDANVVKAFIQSTYDRYYEEFGEFFGNEIPGIFTDEPQYGREDVPWSFILPDKFTEKYGYRIEDCLSALYYKIPEYEKIRYDFWNLVTELFTQAFAKQIGDWCEEHNCKLTGHVLLEEDMRLQTMCSGSAMGNYQYMQMPGIDWLGRNIGNPVLVKQVASVANQLDKKQVLSEMFACSGWNASFEDLKRIAEWQYALGVNVLCAHLEGYSIRGLRKRDHPPGMFYQSPWWDEYYKFNNYFARLGMLLSEGKSEADILVIHPLRSAWIAMEESCYHGAPNEEVKDLDDKFTKLTEILCGLHFNYHYGDEDIIKKHGRIENRNFVIGSCSYSSVIIPPCSTLDSKTITLIKEYVSNGGRVYCFDEFPYLCEGREYNELGVLKGFCKLITLDEQTIEKSLTESAERLAVIRKDDKEVSSIVHQIRKYEDGFVIYMVNLSGEEAFDTVVHVNCDKPIYAVNIQEGTIKEVEVKNEKDISCIKLHFDPTESHMLISCSGLEKEGKSLVVENSSNYIELGDEWKMEFSDLNALTLDYCRYKLKDGNWSERKPTIVVQKELLEFERNVDISLEFTFTSSFDFEEQREAYLVIEDASNYEIVVNGAKVMAESKGWWRDKHFHKVDIKGMICEGKNTVVLSTEFYNSHEVFEKIKRAKVFEAEANMLRYDSEVESIYLLGDFAVGCNDDYIPQESNAFIQAGDFYVDKPKDKIDAKSLVVDGYPFYSGSVKLSQQIDLKDISKYSRLIFKMVKPYAAMSKLYINDIEVKSFLWAPYEADIYGFVKNGINKITIELIGSNRNLLGPHHNPYGELHSLGPVHFTDAFGWVNSYCFVRFGLGDNPAIII